MYPDKITDSFSLRPYYEFGRRSYWWFLCDLIGGSGQGSTCFGPNFSFLLSSSGRSSGLQRKAASLCRSRFFWSVSRSKTVFRIRKYFLRIRICGSVILITNPDPGGQLMTDPARSGSYLAIFLAVKKMFRQIGTGTGSNFISLTVFNN